MIAVISHRRDWTVMCDCSVLDGYRFMGLLSGSWISVTSLWFSWMRSFLGVEGWMWALVLGREATCCSSSVTWTSSSLPTSWTHAVWMPSLVREERDIYIYSTYRAEPIWTLENDFALETKYWTNQMRWELFSEITSFFPTTSALTFNQLLSRFLVDE